MFFSFSQAQKAESRGDEVEMAKNHRISLFLNLGTIINYIVTWTIVLVSIIVNVIVIVNGTS